MRCLAPSSNNNTRNNQTSGTSPAIASSNSMEAHKKSCSKAFSQARTKPQRTQPRTQSAWLPLSIQVQLQVAPENSLLVEGNAPLRTQIGRDAGALHDVLMQFQQARMVSG